MRHAFLIFTLWIAGPVPLEAEYRAYVLGIENVDTKEAREVTTTLDHYQYPGYYPVSLRERVYIKATWTCWGPTDDRQICPNPKPVEEPRPETSSDRIPASNIQDAPQP